MTRPDFLVIGAMKCGTSTICAYLEDHPDVFMVPRLDPNYFSKDENFTRDPAWYHDLFPSAPRERRIGEGSNTYAMLSCYPETPARIAAYRSDMQLVFMVRHPLRRISSEWVQRRVDGGDTVPPTMEAAVRRMPELFVDQSLYWRTLLEYLKHFPREQIFLGFLEDLEARPHETLSALCEFLGVALQPQARRPHVNPSVGKRVPGRAYSMTNSIPGAVFLKRRLPKDFKRLVKDRLLSRRALDSPDVTKALDPMTLARIRDDAAALLAFAGKSADYWRLA